MKKRVHVILVVGVGLGILSVAASYLFEPYEKSPQGDEPLHILTDRDTLDNLIVTDARTKLVCPTCGFDQIIRVEIEGVVRLYSNGEQLSSGAKLQIEEESVKRAFFKSYACARCRRLCRGDEFVGIAEWEKREEHKP